MNKEDCLMTVTGIPNYVITIFLIFVTVLMLAVIITIIIAGLDVLLEWYQEKREDYLRVKQIKMQCELLERQKNETRS